MFLKIHLKTLWKTYRFT